MQPDPLEPAIDAAARAAVVEIDQAVSTAIGVRHGDWTLLTNNNGRRLLAEHPVFKAAVRGAVRAAAPIIAAQAERDVIRTWLDEALAQYSHQWTGGDDPDLADWLRERAEMTDAT